MTVITGPSGSGKTSLAFDTVFAEGQRRYVECLSTYARRFLGRLERAPIDHVSGLGPAIAIDQRNSGHNPRSTVATVTELHDHFRLLFANLGVPHCPQCDREVRALPPAIAAGHLIAQAPGPGHLVSRLREPQSAVGLRAQGYARAWVDGPVDLDTVETVNDLVIDRLDPARADRPRIVEAIETAYRLGGNQARFIPRSGSAIPLSVSASCPEHGLIHPGPLTPRHFSFNHWLGACAACDGLGRQWVGASTVVCPGCRGQRLKAEYLAVSFAGLRPAEIAAMTVERARDWFRTLALNATEAHIAAQPTREIRGRLGFLADVGLGYLTLDRTADTLSGGEAQRIRLASQLGGGLCGVIYVLDEPTIGLHPRDTARLLGTLQGLRDLDNTLIVVEHDMQTIRAADHIVDMGPGAGEEGGNVVASGPPATLSGGATGPWLTGVRRFPVRASRRPPGPPFRLQAGTLNNLRDVHVDFPTGQLIAVTGVSGSGKSTLVMDLLVGALNGESVPARLTRPPGEWTHAVVDQAPIGRSPRSTPATYAGVMDPMRALFATTTTAKENGWGVSRFSYNSGAGACTVCGGYGHTLVEMHFLSNVWVRCGACGGRRYAPRTLEARWKGLSIADVLDLRVDHAVEVFAARRNILRPLQALASVGLGYLRLGQPATELSGGEAQRVKLACGLAVRSGHCFYILDEPTTGLHLEDIARLVEVFDHLVDAGHTVLVVEHHLDVIRHADHVIDLGPEAGDGGGNIVAQGTPDEVARVSESHTGAALRAG